MGPATDADAFDEFVRSVEPRLRRALVATYGHERGREAAAEALAWAFEHRGQLDALRNPAAYFYRVGQSRTRLRKQRSLFDVPVAEEPWVEPRLGRALARLPAGQRAAVLLVHVAGMTIAEAAEVLGIRRATVQKRAIRALQALRADVQGADRERE